MYEKTDLFKVKEKKLPERTILLKYQKNLARYISENNFRAIQNNYVGRSS